jgi:hypothetical protein
VDVQADRLEEAIMWNATNRTDYLAGVWLLVQEYLTSLAELKAREGITDIERLRLRHELGEDYRLRRAQEMEAVTTQIKADAALQRN